MAGYNPSFPSSWTIQPDTKDDSDSSRSSTPAPPTPSTLPLTSTTDVPEPESLPPPIASTPETVNTRAAGGYTTHFPSSWLLPSSGPTPPPTDHSQARPRGDTLPPRQGEPQRAATIGGRGLEASRAPPRQAPRLSQSVYLPNRANNGPRLPWMNQQGRPSTYGYGSPAARTVDTNNLGWLALANTTHRDNRAVPIGTVNNTPVQPPQVPTIQTNASYTIAIICPMGVELAAVRGMLDKEHPSLPTTQARNSYTLGEMAGHFVVVAVMPDIGKNTAAAVATQLQNDFRSVRFGLLVGIGGGIPGADEYDIRLGDVVVGTPTLASSSIVQFDQGKIHAGGNFERTGTLNKPPTVLMAHLHNLQAQHLVHGSRIPQYLAEMLQAHPMMDKMQWTYQGYDNDALFEAEYSHQGGKTCERCDRARLLDRAPRPSEAPQIHYGTIGSSNLVVKDALTRERLRRAFGIICVEMEAAGLVDEIPCLVIRGICDYADSHKTKQWQPYAAATAAALAKELLSTIPPRSL